MKNAVLLNLNLTFNQHEWTFAFLYALCFHMLGFVL